MIKKYISIVLFFVIAFILPVTAFFYISNRNEIQNLNSQSLVGITPSNSDNNPEVTSIIPRYNIFSGRETTTEALALYMDLYKIDESEYSQEQRDALVVIIRAFEQIDEMRTLKYYASGGDEYISDEEVIEDFENNLRKTIFKSGGPILFLNNSDYPYVVVESKEGTRKNCNKFDYATASDDIYRVRDYYLEYFAELLISPDERYISKDLKITKIDFSGIKATKYSLIYKIDNSIGSNKTHKILDVVKAEIGPTNSESYVIIGENDELLEIQVEAGHSHRVIRILETNPDVTGEFECNDNL